MVSEFKGNNASMKKIEDDLRKLYKCGKYKVFLQDENIYGMSIQMKGPKDTPYEHGYWRINVELSAEYPFKSPSVGFLNRIYHPNVDFESGTICLDVLNARWSPLYGLADIVEWMIPGLLKEPNADDPLNTSAARLKAADEKSYETKVRHYVEEYASKAAYNKRFYTAGLVDDEDEHAYYVTEEEEEEEKEEDTDEEGEKESQEDDSEMEDGREINGEHVQEEEFEQEESMGYSDDDGQPYGESATSKMLTLQEGKYRETTTMRTTSTTLTTCGSTAVMRSTMDTTMYSDEEMESDALSDIEISDSDLEGYED